MREHVEVRCKPTTVRQCRHTLDYHLLPALGTEPLGTIGRERVATLHYSLHQTPVMANKVVDMLSRLFYMAEGWGIAQVRAQVLRSAAASISSPRRSSDVSDGFWAKSKPKARCVRARWQRFAC